MLQPLDNPLGFPIERTSEDRRPILQPAPVEGSEGEAERDTLEGMGPPEDDDHDLCPMTVTP